MKKLMIMVAALAMVAGFAMSAAAADWNFYGSARMETFYTDTEIVGGSDFNGYEQGLAGNSRIGANVKVSDELSGRFEYGTGVNLRLLYGTWNFGSGALTIGQDYTPLMMAFGNQVRNGATGLIGYGALYAGRRPQVALRFGNFKAAVVDPQDLSSYTDTFAAAATTISEGQTRSEAAVAGYADLLAWDTANATYASNIVYKHSIPNIQMSYFHDFGGLRLRAQGGYGTSEVKDTNLASPYSVDVDSYVLALAASYKAGGFYVTGTWHMGDNVSGLGVATQAGSLPAIDTAARTAIDTETTAYTIFAGYAVNDMFSFEAGYGNEETELGAFTGDATSYYLNATIAFAPGVFIVPEIGTFDSEDFNGIKNTYYGLKWQINF